MRFVHVIAFNPTSKDAEIMVPPPKPSAKYLPSWYSNLPVFSDNRLEIFNEGDLGNGGAANLTLKMCVPFKDALTAGYVQEIWQDVHFDFGSGSSKNAVCTAATDNPIMISHREYSSLPIGDDFYPVEFVFHPPWVPELPSGWSVLYVSMLNHADSPFWVPSAIVDADSFTHSPENANLPFYVKKNFSNENYGIIKKGTPLYQMIPIKRENWKSKINQFNEVLQKRVGKEPRKHFWGGYKKTFWQKKEYR